MTLSLPTQERAAPPRWPTTVVIPNTWTPAQALAVIELLNDLREAVAALYLDQMQAHLRQEQGDDVTAVKREVGASDDLMF